MSLRYAILGTLSSAPSSGYDLARQFDLGLGWFWSAAHSQIYPELKRLEGDGMVTGSSTTVGEKLEKRIYTITDAGRQDVKAWAGDDPQYRPNRDPERVQLIFADLGDIADIRHHLEAHRDHFAGRRGRLEETRNLILARQHDRVEQRLKNKSKAQQELTLLLRDLAYGGDIERVKLETEWAEESLARLDEFEEQYPDPKRNGAAAGPPARKPRSKPRKKPRTAKR